MTEYLKYILPSSSVPNSPITAHVYVDEIDEIPSHDYRFESARLESFKDWPCVWMKPEKLAASGFYYTGQGDQVKCFECQIEICRWQSDDNPLVEHQRWSGKCRFIRKMPCGNVPIGVDPDTIPVVASKGRDVCGPYGVVYMPASSPDTHETLEELEDTVQFNLGAYANMSPKHPDFASYDERLRSFATWPETKSQSKEELATAGFYYTKHADQTLCYHCGGGLRDWEPEDNPWTEHAKWFDYCPYLLMVKGRDFISKVTGKTYYPSNAEPTSINGLDEKVEDSHNQSVAGGSSQNSVSSIEDTNVESGTEGSSEASTEQEQSIVKANSDKSIDKDARMCKICYTRELRMVFMPCGHLLACAECAKNMKTCGVCRKPVKITVQAYIP